MNRKNFILSQGATCLNWQWSWGFIDKKNRIIIFGWNDENKGSFAAILDKKWEYSDKGRRNPGYRESIEYMRLIHEEGYQLKTFPIHYSNERKDEFGRGPSKIKSFKPTLTNKTLYYSNNVWYAIDENVDSTIPEQLDESETYIEGAKKKLIVNAYERDGRARAKCIEHYGYKCVVCCFDFSEFYGSIGEDYIHVHHIKQLSTVEKEYQVDPINDLIPVCPNCHAMIHRRKQALTIEELKSHIEKNRK